MAVTRHLTISGRVQGVFFRESMRAEAERLGVTGWVRNRSDGTVEAVVQGTQDAVAAIILWAQRGAGRAQVTKVDVATSPPTPLREAERGANCTLSRERGERSEGGGADGERAGGSETYLHFDKLPSE